MKKLVSTLVLGVALTFSSIAAADLKIAVVNVDLIFDQMPQTKATFEAIEKEFKAKTDKLTKERDNVEKAGQKLQKESMTLSAKEKEKLITTIKNFESSAQNMGKEYDQRVFEARVGLYQKIGKNISEIAKKEGYDIVLTNQSVGYVSDKVDDMTQTVLQQVEQEDKTVDQTDKK